MHQIDLFDGVRRLRADFASAWPDIDEATLNHGVPTHPAVEYEADMRPPSSTTSRRCWVRLARR